MANDIASQVQEKIERVQDVVFAMDNLSALATTLGYNDVAAHAYADLHHFCAQVLVERFTLLNTDLRERVLPFVSGVKSMRLS